MEPNPPSPGCRQVCPFAPVAHNRLSMDQVVVKGSAKRCLGDARPIRVGSARMEIVSVPPQTNLAD
jgi:hypothetical protein